MAMETVLTTLEEKIEQVLESHRAAKAREHELTDRIGELEAQVETDGGLTERVQELESQRDDLKARLEKVLGLIDAALEGDSGPATGD
jgi:uncharacterized coiled-coil DUF342 family protein